MPKERPCDDGDVSYGNIYVARVAMGASDMQTVRAFIEAEAYDGPSLIICLWALYCSRNRYEHGYEKPESCCRLRILAIV